MNASALRSDEEIYRAQRTALRLSAVETNQELTMRIPIQRHDSCLSGVNSSTREIHFSFSSTTPIRRKFGWAILSHDRSSLDTTNLSRGLVPFLIDHDYDQAVGEVVNYALGDDKNFATARIFQTPLGDKVLAEIEGGRTAISASYTIDEMQLARETPGQEDNSYLITLYTLLEVSSVPAGADPTSRIGKAAMLATLSRDQLTKAAILAGMRDAWEEEQEADRLRLLFAHCENLPLLY
jgi:hypothetical protein